MKPTLFRTAALTFALSIALAAPGSAQDDEFSWSGHIAQGRTIEIKNANGPLFAEYTSGDQVVVTAVKDGPDSDREEVSIEVVEHDGGVTICSIYPNSWTSRNRCAPGDEGHIGSNKNKTKVTFTIRVPAGVKLVAKTMNGKIAVQELQSNVEVMTMNGAITVSTSGWARAKTMNGAIEAHMGATDWTGDLELETMNGAVTVYLPADANAEVNASTMNGKVDSDWSLKKSGWLRNKAHGTIGSGGRRIEISTMNGSIRIRRAS